MPRSVFLQSVVPRDVIHPSTSCVAEYGLSDSSQSIDLDFVRIENSRGTPELGCRVVDRHNVLMSHEYDRLEVLVTPFERYEKSIFCDLFDGKLRMDKWESSFEVVVKGLEDVVARLLMRVDVHVVERFGGLQNERNYQSVRDERNQKAD